MPTQKSKPTLKLWQRQLVILIAFVVLLALSAQQTLDLGFTIPFTLQTLTLGLGYLFLERNWRFVAIGIYLAIGIAGLAVFSDGTSGWEHFTGNSLGFFIGFVLAAWIKPLKYSFQNYFSYFILIHLIIIASGAAILMIKEKSIEPLTILSMALIPGAVIKSLLGAAIAQILDRKLKLL